jgi:hypothetical protein
MNLVLSLGGLSMGYFAVLLVLVASAFMCVGTLIFATASVITIACLEFFIICQRAMCELAAIITLKVDDGEAAKGRARQLRDWKISRVGIFDD